MLSHLPHVPRHRALAALALFLATLASPAHAVPLISQNTWIETVSLTCSNSASCSVEFTAIPKARTLVARNVSCRLAFASSESSSTSLFTLSGNGHTTYLVAGALKTIGSAKQSFTNTEIFVPFAALQTPIVRHAITGAAISQILLSCTLAGELRP